MWNPRWLTPVVRHEIESVSFARKYEIYTTNSQCDYRSACRFKKYMRMEIRDSNMVLIKCERNVLCVSRNKGFSFLISFRIKLILFLPFRLYFRLSQFYHIIINWNLETNESALYKLFPWSASREILFQNPIHNN